MKSFALLENERNSWKCERARVKRRPTRRTKNGEVGMGEKDGEGYGKGEGFSFCAVKRAGSL